MATFHFFPLSQSLQPHVLSLFYLEVGKNALLEPQLMVPDGSCCLYLNMGEPLSIIDMDGVTRFRRYPQKILGRGLLSRPHFLDASMGLKVWGIKFRPDVWNTRGFTQNEYFCDDGLEEQFSSLWDLANAAVTMERGAREILRVLGGLVPQLFPGASGAFLGVLEEIRYSRGSGKIDEVLEDFGLDYKTVERAFLRHVGVTPKDYSKILRIAAAVTEMLAEGRIPTYSLRSFGYFDAAHFFKDFRQYFSTTPKKMIQDLPSRCLLLNRKVTKEELFLMQ